MEAIVWFTVSLLSILMPIIVVVVMKGDTTDKWEKPSIVAVTLAFFSGIVFGMILAIFWQFICAYGGVQLDQFG